MTTTGRRDDTDTDLESVLRSRLGRLDLEQKVRLLTGADFWALHPEPAIGLRRLVTSDGPAGVRGEAWDEREPVGERAVPDRAGGHLGRGPVWSGSGGCWPARRAARASTCCWLRR